MTDIQATRFGKYLLLDKMAVGGMAELYRAMITAVQGFEKLIAIKKILPHLATEEELIRSFIDEAKLAALLHHQNIVQIYDFGSLEGTYFIAMEYLSGRDLRAIAVKAKKVGLPLPLELAVFITSRICSGLHYAHNLKDFQGKPLNLIHRDISPQNILITYEGEIKVVDFGIAKAASKTTMTQIGMIKGKVAYMSPEQAEGKIIDQRSDIFSVGIILYEMLTGKRMFDGETLQILSNVRHAKFEPPETLKSDLPTHLYDILHRALAKDPKDRYQSCGDMLTDLEDCMEKNAMRPTSRGLSQYMRSLFKEEISSEEEIMRDIAGISGTEAVDAAESPAQSRLAKGGLNRVKEWGNSCAENIKKRVRLKERGAALSERLAGIKDGVKLKERLDSCGQALKKLGEFPARALDPGWWKEKNRIQIGGGIALALALIVVITLAVLPGKEGKKAGSVQTAALTANDTSAGNEAVSSRPPGAEQKALSPEARMVEAVKALEEKRYSEAADLFEKLLDDEPGLRKQAAPPLARALEGRAAGVAGRNPDLAQKLLIKASGLDPGNATCLHQLGLLYMKSQEYQKAINTYKKVIKLDPEFSDAFFNLGFIYAKTREYARAEKMYSRVVELMPAYLDEALVNLAVVQDKQGKRKDSLKNLRQALYVNPSNKLAKNYLDKLTGSAGGHK